MDINNSRLSVDEMGELFAKDNPGFVPNKRRIGCFAKQHGYKLVKQMVSGVVKYFYIKNKTITK